MLQINPHYYMVLRSSNARVNDAKHQLYQRWITSPLGSPPQCRVHHLCDYCSIDVARFTSQYVCVRGVYGCVHLCAVYTVCVCCVRLCTLPYTVSVYGSHKCVLFLCIKGNKTAFPGDAIISFIDWGKMREIYVDAIAKVRFNFTVYVLLSALKCCMYYSYASHDLYFILFFFSPPIVIELNNILSENILFVLATAEKRGKCWWLKNTSGKWACKIQFFSAFRIKINIPSAAWKYKEFGPFFSSPSD